MTSTDSTSASRPEAAARSTWRTRVEKELGPGRDFARTLVTRTLEGLEIGPLYAVEESSGREAVAFPPPSGPWTIAPSCIHPSPEQANRDLLEDLNEGATGCAIELGRAAKGLDSEGAGAAEGGVDVRDLATLEKLLDGVYLDAIPIAFESNANGLALAATFAALCAERGVDVNECQVQLAFDPVAALARDGALPGDMTDARAELVKLASHSRVHWNRGTSLAVDAGVWHRAGGHAAQELGLALATFVQYLRWLDDGGLAPAQAYAEFVWRFDLGRDLFTNIAKLRAARELHARVLGSMGMDECRAMAIGATTSPRGLSRRDPWTNMLRTSLGVFAGAAGGADMITALPFDAALGLPSPLGRRNARNTQLVLAHESRLDHVGDPSRGSHYVEAHTAELCEAAWAVFLAVEEEGGMVAALENDWVAGELDRSRAQLEDEIAHRRWPIVGVSEYPGADLEIDSDSAAAQAAEIEAARRDASARIEARGTMSIGAIDTIEHATDAAAKGATLEEIGDALVRGAPLRMKPLPAFRESAAFEEVCAAAAGLSDSGAGAPRVFLACLGSLAEHSARAGFATQLIMAGGVEVEQCAPDLDAEGLRAAFTASSAKVACIAGSDDAYEAEASLEALRALRTAGASAVWIAAPPNRAAKPLEDEGLDGHLYMGCNAARSLQAILRQLGADLPEVSL